MNRWLKSHWDADLPRLFKGSNLNSNIFFTKLALKMNTLWLLCHWGGVPNGFLSLSLWGNPQNVYAVYNRGLPFESKFCKGTWKNTESWEVWYFYSFWHQPNPDTSLWGCDASGSSYHTSAANSLSSSKGLCGKRHQENAGPFLKKPTTKHYTLFSNQNQSRDQSLNAVSRPFTTL